VAEFQFLCGGKKIKHRRAGNECRLTRCPFVVSSVCCSPVKMVYFLFLFWSSVQCLQCRFTIGYNEKVKAMSDWCNKTNIEFTPTFFISLPFPLGEGQGVRFYQLPDIYSVDDVNYFLTE